MEFNFSGEHVQESTGRKLRYWACCDADGPTGVGYCASIEEGDRHLARVEGWFEYDPSKSNPREAGRAHLVAHIEQTTFGEGTEIQQPKFPARFFRKGWL